MRGSERQILPRLLPPDIGHYRYQFARADTKHYHAQTTNSPEVRPFGDGGAEL